MGQPLSFPYSLSFPQRLSIARVAPAQSDLEERMQGTVNDWLAEIREGEAMRTWRRYLRRRQPGQRMAGKQTCA